MMKHLINRYRSRLRLWLATAFYVATLPFGVGKKHAGKTRVLVFHHLDNAPRFAKILQTLETRYNFISFADYTAGRVAADKINIIIALDDGYASWHRTGLPLFQRHGIKPLLFINSGFTNLDEQAAHTFCTSNITTWPEASLNWQQLKELADAGADIGGHSAKHINMLKATDKQMLDDLTTDRNQLGAQLGHLPRNFAYPFGLHNEAARNTAKWAGYDFAFTSDSGWLNNSPGPLQLNRSNVGLRPLLMVCAEVEGWGDWVSSLIRKAKQGRASWSAD